MVSGEYNYKSPCKHCGAKPFSEGPHHHATCVRHQPMVATESDLVLQYECRYCGVEPFIAGPHHAADCRRFFEVESTGISLATGEKDEAIQPGRRMTLESILDIFKSAEAPALTVGEVAETLDCSPEAAHSGLKWLVDRGDLYEKSVGPNSEVFLLLEEISDP